MSRTKIVLNGMVRNVPESSVRDGACEEVINLRYRDDSWQVVPEKVDIGVVPDAYDKIWIHKGNGYENYLGYKYSKVYWFDKDTGEIKQEVVLGVSSVGSAQFVGNTANFIGNSNVVSALFYEGHYYLFSDIKIPDVNIKVGEGHNWYKVAASDDIFAGIDIVKLDNGDSLEHKKFTGNLKGLYGKAMDSIEQRGYFEGHVLVRCVLEMYDGSPFYVYPFLYYRSPKRENDTITVGASPSSVGHDIEDAEAVSITSRGNSLSLYVRYGNIELSIPNVELSDVQKKIVSALSVYVSKPLSAFDLDKTRTFVHAGKRNYNLFEINDFEHKLFEEQLPLYKVETISVDEITANYSKELVFDVNTMTSLPIFTDEKSDMHQYTGQSSFSLNNRLHLGGITTNYFDGYLAQFFSNDDLGNRYRVTIRTYLLSNEEYVTVTDSSDFMSAPITMNAVIGYPDNRATKMVVQVHDLNADTYSFKTFRLQKSAHYNYAYYFNKEVFLDSGGDRPLQKEKYTPITIGHTFSVGNPFGMRFYIRNDREKSTNKVKVSELNNAYVFPAKHTYLIGKGDVVGFTSNAVALSQGQFGQHPLLVFSSEGIWAITQGSGEVIYGNVIPVNREVCNNASSITQLDRETAFTTTKGLMIISGWEVKEISMSVEGAPETLQTTNATYEGAVNNMQLVSLKENHSTIGFKDYLKEAKIGYDYSNKELIISNAAYPYSYVYGLDNGMWHKTTEQYELFVNNYPNTLGISSGKMVDVSVEDNSNTQVLLQTKAIKFDTESYKAMRRVILRGLLKVSAGKYAGFYVFGSYDAEKWAYLGGIQNKNEFRDMVAKTLHTDCKYFKIVFAGELAHDSYINYLELESMYEEQGRLR